MRLWSSPQGVRISRPSDDNRRRWGLPHFFDLERLISRQKVARATARALWCTSAALFHAHPLRCGPNLIRLSDSHEKACNQVSPNSAWRATNGEISSPCLKSREGPNSPVADGLPKGESTGGTQSDTFSVFVGTARGWLA